MAPKKSFRKAYIGIVMDMAPALLMYENVSVFSGLLVGKSLHFLASECDKLRRLTHSQAGANSDKYRRLPGWRSVTLRAECLQMLVFRHFSNAAPLIGSNSNVLAKFSLFVNRWLTCLNLMSLSRQLLRWSRSRDTN